MVPTEQNRQLWHRSRVVDAGAQFLCCNSRQMRLDMANFIFTGPFLDPPSFRIVDSEPVFREARVLATIAATHHSEARFPASGH